MAAFASRYARAFADVVASAHLDPTAIDRQLNDFVATWNGSKELRDLFENPAVPAPQKVAILDAMNKKLGLERELRNLIAVLINNDRIAHIREVAEAYRAEMQARLGIRQAEIVTAPPNWPAPRCRPRSSWTRTFLAAPWSVSAPQSTTDPFAAAWSG
jgi:F-type H+-transporting ATPase subunit delta